MSYDDDTIQAANILIADDDPAILRLFTHILEQGGHHVRTAADGNLALHLILQDCPDVLITDWMMPGLDGLELCRRIRQLHQRKVLPHYTYILLLTAQTGKHYFIEGLESGADDFLEKSAESLTNLRVEIRARLKAALRTRKLEKDLEFAAKYDATTKLLNRPTFFEFAQVVWDRSIKNKFPLSVVMFDCDFFKRVNDIHGHLAGDAVLREIGSVLRQFSRSSDIITRYGGEEFCVMLPGCNEKTAWNWAERVREQFEKVPVRHEKLDIPITVSFGIAERADDTTHLDQLIDRADQALLFAKETGRNRSICYSETISEDTSKSISAELRRVYDLFHNVHAKDVMVQIPQLITQETLFSKVIDILLDTEIEDIPVVDAVGNMVGVLSEKSCLTMIGTRERWAEPIGDLVVPNVITYPSETPLRDIFNFLCRTSIRQVILVDGPKPVGTIGRLSILRWMRKQWSEFNDNEK